MLHRRRCGILSCWSLKAVRPLYSLQSLRSSSACQLTISDLTHALVQASQPCILLNPRSGGSDNDAPCRSVSSGTSLYSKWEGNPQGPAEEAQSVSSGPSSQHAAADHKMSIGNVNNNEAVANTWTHLVERWSISRGVLHDLSKQLHCICSRSYVVGPIVTVITQRSLGL